MHANFLAAICAEPDDLTHRLVYADWLEEYGTTDLDAARAQLIRVQIAREAADLDGDEFWSLRAREHVLVGVWGDGLSAGVREPVADHQFRRGFVEAASMDVEVLLREGDRLRAATPLRTVTLSGSADRLTPEAMAGFDGLCLWNPLWMVENREAQRRLADAVQVCRLDVSPAWWEFLVAVLERGVPLKYLGLGSASVPGAGGQPQYVLPFDAEQVDFLRTASVPPTLRAFDLRGAAIDQATGRELFATPWMQGIEQLLLGTQTTDGRDLVCPLARSNLRNLRALWLTGQFPDGRESVGPALRGLRHLILYGVYQLRSEHAEVLRSLQMEGLRTLRIAYTDQIPGLVRLLRHSPEVWPQLRILEFRRWQRNWHEEVQRVLRSPCLPLLRRLELPGLPEEGMPEDSGPLQLAELTLTAHDVSTSIRGIARSPVLGNLTALEIARGRIYQPGDLEPLLDRDRFPRLVRLHIGGLNLDATWRRRFAERFGPGAVFSAEPITAFAVHDRILGGSA
jgi:uncharacterized protein (TIGR02996 family)